MSARRATPPSRCHVCQHPDRDRLDERLALDLDTVASLAASEGLPVLHVWDHRSRHLDAAWSGEVERMGAPLSVAHLRAVTVSSMHDVRSIAHDREERARTRVEAHNSVRGYVEAISRHLLESGVDDAESPTVIVQVVGVIRDQLAGHPEALVALDSALAALGGEAADGAAV